MQNTANIRICHAAEERYSRYLGNVSVTVSFSSGQLLIITFKIKLFC